MMRYLPNSVRYCSLTRAHKITKNFHMVEASQKGYVTHVVMCDRTHGGLDGKIPAGTAKS